MTIIPKAECLIEVTACALFQSKRFGKKIFREFNKLSNITAFGRQF